MKANKFIKKHGVVAAKALLVESTGCSLYVDMNYKVTIYQHGDRPSNCDEIDFIVHRDDLKRLVESHELVESVQALGRTGYEEVKSHLEHCDPKWCHFHSRKWRQAIADVEACQ